MCASTGVGLFSNSFALIVLGPSIVSAARRLMAVMILCDSTRSIPPILQMWSLTVLNTLSLTSVCTLPLKKMHVLRESGTKISRFLSNLMFAELSSNKNTKACDRQPYLLPFILEKF